MISAGVVLAISLVSSYLILKSKVEDAQEKIEDARKAYEDTREKYEDAKLRYEQARQAVNEREKMRELEILLLDGDLIKKLREGTVYVKGLKDSDCAGFVLDNHAVVTAKHCMSTEEELVGVSFFKPTKAEADFSNFQSGTKIVKYEMVSHKDKDLAVIVFSKPVFDAKRALNVAREVPKVDDPVVFCGHPLADDFKVEGGIISDFDKDKEGRVIINGVTFPGNSGGPVLDRNGNVFGIMISGSLSMAKPDSRATLINLAEINELVRAAEMKLGLENTKIVEKDGKIDKKMIPDVLADVWKQVSRLFGGVQKAGKGVAKAKQKTAKDSERPGFSGLKGLGGLGGIDTGGYGSYSRRQLQDVSNPGGKRKPFKRHKGSF